MLSSFMKSQSLILLLIININKPGFSQVLPIRCVQALASPILR